MELKELIERAEKTAGSQKALGLRIGQSPSNIRNAKAGIKGLPNYACVMIADLIGEDRITVIAASELVTEKREERRKVWHPFVARAATVLLGAVILNMSPAPANAATAGYPIDNTVYYVKCNELNWQSKSNVEASTVVSIASTLKIQFDGENIQMMASRWPVWFCCSRESAT